MALRIKAKWHRSRRSERNREGSSKPKTPEQLAGVIAFNIWKVAQELFRHMEKEGFRFAEDSQVTGVITEVIAFLVQIVDRMVYDQLDEEQRRNFITALAKDLAKTMASNQIDLFGPGDYTTPFVDTLNSRFADYAEFPYSDEGPSYAAKRYLGDKVAEVMAATDAKWVLEHVMEIELPEAIKTVQRLTADVVGLRKS